MTREELRTGMLGVICGTVVLAAMGVAAELFAPMVAAIVLGIVCAPLTDKVERAGIPRSLAALMVLLLFLAALVSLFLVVEPKVSKAFRNSSEIWSELTGALDVFKDALSGVRNIQENVSEALNEGEGAAPPAQAAEEEAVKVPTTMEALAFAPRIVGALLILVGTLYFFLMARTDIYDRVDKMKWRLSKDVLSTAEARVSKYFLTITMINATFGSVVGVMLTTLGMPNALLWGLAAFLVNFILYLGPMFFAAALAIAGVVEFDGPYSFLPAALYIAMNMTEGQFVTPSLVGRQMHVNPLMVFVSLVFWLWLWGPVGAVVAIPILVWCLYVVEHMNEARAQVTVIKDGERTDETPSAA